MIPASLRVLHEPVFYPEGPAWEAGRLYFVEYARHAINALDLARREQQTVWQQPGFGPAAVAFAPDGALWVTGSDSNSVARIDRDGTPQIVLRQDVAGSPFPAPNDLVFDRFGGLYFTASGVFDRDAPVAGCVFHHQLEGDTQLLAGDIHYANGVALSTDAATLFVTEHFRNRVLAFDVVPDRSLRGRRVYADLNNLAPLNREDPLLGPDGIAFSSGGKLLVAQFGAGRLLIIGQDACLEEIVDLPFRYPTNVTFGETEQRLYVTALRENAAPFRGAILEIDLKNQ
jgi:gluconolactonase